MDKPGGGFATLARENEEGAQRSLWIQNLQNNGCSKSAVAQVVSQGAQLSDLKAACSCVQLKDNGYALQDLNQVCACKELKAAGFNARQLKDAGYTAERLRECGFNACELRSAGFSAQEMKDAGFSEGELKGAGYTDDEISRASGLPEGATAADILKSGCSVDALSKLRKQGVSASAIRRISGCSAEQLKATGYTAKELKDAGFSAADLKKAGFTPEELKTAGYSARDLLNAGFSPENLAQAGYTPVQIKEGEEQLPPGLTAGEIKRAGCDPDTLRREREAGVSALMMRQHAGCSVQALKAVGFTEADLANAGFSAQDIRAASPLTEAQIRAAGCDSAELKKLLAAGVSAKKIKNLNECSAEKLKDAGYASKSLLDMGITPEQLLAAGLSAKDVENAGTNPADILASGRGANCSVESLKKARAAGVSAATIKKTLGCSAKALKDAGYTAKELKDAGFTSAELKNAGFSARDLKNAGFSPKELKDAGFSAKELKDAGFTAAELKNAGFSAKDLKDTGFTPAQLKAAGFSAKDLKDSGFTQADLKAANFSPSDLEAAGYVAAQSQVAGLGGPNIQQGAFSIGGVPGQPKGSAISTQSQQLQAILSRQNLQMAEQKHQQKIQQKTSDMLSAANQLISEWKTVSTQTYTIGQEDKSEKSDSEGSERSDTLGGSQSLSERSSSQAIIKTGDVIFAVLDTSVNSDEPGPILATIVTGKLRGTKLIGSFNLPSNANKMVITFNTMSIPGAPKTTSISAYAIDPNTARTALASRTNHHYLMRYGSLFASSFLEGFGNAFQSANTTVTIGGTGGGNNVTVSNGVGRSTLENAVIGLATVGKAWGQQAQQLFNTPTTVEVYAGTPLGILFTQDVRSI